MAARLKRAIPTPAAILDAPASVDPSAARVLARVGLAEDESAPTREALASTLSPTFGQNRSWRAFVHRASIHGRFVCTARAPRCVDCPLADLCPSRTVEPKDLARDREKREQAILLDATGRDLAPKPRTRSAAAKVAARSARTHLDAMKREVFAAFCAALENALRRPAFSTVRARRERVEIGLSNGGRAVIYVATVKNGFAPGEFGAYTGFSLSGGPIDEVLVATGLHESDRASNDALVTGTSHHLVARLSRGVYAFRAGTNIEALATKMGRDAARSYLPILEAFATNYPAALDFVLSHDGAHVRRPFATCLVLLFLSGSSRQVGGLVERARSKPGFWDLHRAKDGGAETLRRVADHFASA